jgi:hypothetical protein
MESSRNREKKAEVCQTAVRPVQPSTQGAVGRIRIGISRCRLRVGQSGKPGCARSGYVVSGGNVWPELMTLEM